MCVYCSRGTTDRRRKKDKGGKRRKGGGKVGGYRKTRVEMKREEGVS